MAKRKIEIYTDVYTEKDFDYMLNSSKENIICAQIYCSYFGYCTALDHLFLKIKLDWSDGQAVLLRVAADEIDSLERFRGQSEPVFLFILNRRVINVFRGVDYVTFGEVAKKEIEYFKQIKEGCHIERQTYAIDEATPDEIEWLNARKTEKEELVANALALKASRQEARKKHRAELMVPHLRHLNFVLYWPHTKHAHPELYERWDPHNIIMVGREEIQLTREMAEDVLYAGDAPINEASMYELLSAPALAICFRILDTERNFVELIRKILYEEIPPLDESKPISDQPPQKTAFDLYKSYSLTKEEILETRREERDKRKAQARESRARRLSEMQRMARQAIEYTIEARRMEREAKKIEILKAGNLKALEDFERSTLDIEVDIVIPEALSDEELEASSEEENDEEYFPPAGLLIPGFYAPPNEIAKVNGLAVLFPKIVLESVTPQPEFLPPHVLVLLDMTKRYKAVEILAKHKSAVIHMGIFQLNDPLFSNNLHVAYSIKQFESLQLNTNLDNMKLAVMLSVQIDLPLLGLMDLSPCYVSRDATAGEADCAAIFPVDYGDDYPEFEDFDLP
ncbi:thioredoxin domain-containing protein 3 homolog [Papilio machaon]|uniref:thioredoxin domain-containing protein 3 homolog n=1 Tax=Papilio machaon TaxID=76193 RepID=UPI001E663031|nr:thioredoxin domain-containing protein 3 homolog [Papilio machaon]